jgi:Lar family restriction alleviation protein
MESKLLPCPFCGGEAFLHEGIGNDKHYGWSIWCCTFEGKCIRPSSGYYSTEAEAIAAWNRRADGWIDCKTRLPEHLEEVLVATRKGLVLAAEVCHNSFFDPRGDQYSEIMGITHWQPLPAAPSGVK